MKYLLFCFLYKIKPFPKPHCFQLVSTISLIHTSKMFVPFSSGKKINQKLSLQSSNFYLFCLFFPHFRNMSSNGVCLPVSTCTTDGTTGRVKHNRFRVRQKCQTALEKIMKLPEKFTVAPGKDLTAHPHPWAGSVRISFVFNRLSVCSRSKA